MNSRERTLTALRHESPDRVPRNFWAEPPTWNRLFDYAGHREPERILNELEIDLRSLQITAPPEKEIADGLFRNFWGEQYVYRQTAWGPMREDTKGALANAMSLSDLESFDWPTHDMFDYSVLPEQIHRLDEYALIYGFADIWERPALVRGLENMFLDMCERPDWDHFLCRKFTDFYREDYTRAAEVSAGRIDLFLLISDLGSQRGPLISRKMFREFIAPYIREMCGLIHSFGAKVLYHSCGNIRLFIPDLIELGVDVLDPIQPIGAMKPEELKAEFGDQLCFHGGIDIQRILPFGTPEEVQAEAERYSAILGRGGGYILSPAHLFQPDIPPKNIYAMYGR
jgi:uroporphyrinogen decarboxylase